MFQDNQEFCVLPLTHDFDANPFRFDIETARSSQLLLHAILALSYKHINRDTGSWANESTDHKRKALRMLSDMEATSPVSQLDSTSLDAALILMTLDVCFAAPRCAMTQTMANRDTSAQLQRTDRGWPISNAHTA